MADGVIRAEPDSPTRCQAVNKHGQCNLESMPGCTMCQMHGGPSQQRVNEATSLKNYRLTKFQARLERLVDSPNIKCLRDEIAILRMLLEEKLESCKDSMDLIYQSGPISDLVLKIDKLVSSCHKLEEKMGSVLDKQAVIQFGSEIISIIASEVNDEETVGKISGRILATVSKTFDDEED